MCKHIRETCKISPRVGNEGGFALLYKYVKTQQDRMVDTIDEKFKTMSEDIHRIRPSNIDNRIINKNTVENININFNIFGKEDLSQITAKTIRGIIDNVQTICPSLNQAGSPGYEYTSPLVVAAALQVLGRAASLIYSDLEHPENITCFLPGRQDDFRTDHPDMNSDALIHGDNGWEFCSQKVVLPKMADATIDTVLSRQPMPGEVGCSDLSRVDHYEPAMYAVEKLSANLERLDTLNRMRRVLLSNRELLEIVADVIKTEKEKEKEKGKRNIHV